MMIALISSESIARSGRLYQPSLFPDAERLKSLVLQKIRENTWSKMFFSQRIKVPVLTYYQKEKRFVQKFVTFIWRAETWKALGKRHPFIIALVSLPAFSSHPAFWRWVRARETSCGRRTWNTALKSKERWVELWVLGSRRCLSKLRSVEIASNISSLDQKGSENLQRY